MVSRFLLRIEQPRLAAVAFPPCEQFGGDAGDAGPLYRAPFFQAGADGVDQRHLAPHAAAASGALHPGAGVAIPVAGGAAACQALWRFALTQVPVLRGFDEWRVEDRGGDLEPATGFQCATHAKGRVKVLASFG
jgi:hypothetical protein